MQEYQRYLKQPSRKLRNRMTDAEHQLWRKIRRKQLGGFTFNRQKPIGPFIVDFYCNAAKLVIELDGSQHYTVDGLAADRERDEYLSGVGLSVLRFPNDQVFNNMNGVIQTIMAELKSPPPPPFGKGGERTPMTPLQKEGCEVHIGIPTGRFPPFKNSS